MSRQHFSTECEQLLRGQVTSELFAANTYLSMATYFSQSNVALPGFAKYFRRQVEEVGRFVAILLFNIGTFACPKANRLCYQAGWNNALSGYTGCFQ